MIINFENIEDAIYAEIKEEMITCGKFDAETCSRLTKESIRLANAADCLLKACKLSKKLTLGPSFEFQDSIMCTLNESIAKAEGRNL